MKDWLQIIAVLVGIPALLGIFVYSKWVVYFQRFPDAAWWTFFFSVR